MIDLGFYLIWSNRNYQSNYLVILVIGGHDSRLSDLTSEVGSNIASYSICLILNCQSNLTVILVMTDDYSRLDTVL